MRNEKGQLIKVAPNPNKGKTLPWNDKAIEGRRKSGMYNNLEHLSEFNFKKGHKPHNWKGDEVCYKGNVALHSWIKRQLGFPNKCEHCGFESDSHHKIHWANKSHEYKRDVLDWIRLCVPCHKKYDLDFIKSKIV